MKKKILLCPVAIMLVFCCVLSCRKSFTPDPNANKTKPADSSNTNPVPLPQYIPNPNACPLLPLYGDTILYTQPSNQDYLVKPLNNPDTGTYYSWPVGMSLDPNTGVIDLSKSETGLRYKIGFVKKGSTDTCMQNLVLAGISYADSIYVLADHNLVAKPYYNANVNLGPVCSGPGSGCFFDVNGLARSQHIAIDPATGIIDLQQTLNQGAFGLIPLNGSTLQSTVYYKLNDNSNMALQQIPVTLIYYFRKADVPPNLLTQIESKLSDILGNLIILGPAGNGGARPANNPRPPIIIVTRFN